MPAAPPATTVVVVTWRGAGHIAACLDAVAAQQRPHRLLVVDNASDDGTAAIVAAHPSRPRVLRLERNAGYAGGIAAALADMTLAEVDTRYVAWLNDDTEPASDWLSRLEDALDADPRAAAAGPRLDHADGRPQSLGVALTADGHGVDLAHAATREVFGFCGGAAVVRTEALRAVGGVPPEFFCYYEDTDTSWRLRLAGWRVVAVPAARVRHTHGASTRIGSPPFHRWNERNRLLMLIRCAPATVALRELARFKLITLVLPLRRLLRTGPVPDAPNFRVGLRLRVLADVTVLLPAALRARRAGAAAGVTAAGRRALWHRWAGSRG